MKAGFKPKNMTKKEWQDNRSSAAKGSGVGKALDAWQKHCHSALNKMTGEQLKAASVATNALLTALDVAEKKCDKKRQKETIDGIGKYRSIAKSYQKCVKEAAKVIGQRATFAKEVNGLGQVRKDASLRKCYLLWAAGPGMCNAEANGYMLAAENKDKELYTKWIGTNPPLLNIQKMQFNSYTAKYRDGKDVPDATMKSARSQIVHDLYNMLNPRMTDFRKSDIFKAYLRRRFMVPDFTY